MKWAFLLGSPDISGGTYVIFEHAIRARRRGVHVTMVTRQTVSSRDLYWHPEARELEWKCFDELGDESFDVVIATWWRTVFDAHRVRAKAYAYFVQSIESLFYAPHERALRQLADSTYQAGLPVITEATWIKEHLAETAGAQARLVHNGIRKDIYTEQGDAIAPREPGRLRILVEGAFDSAFKNVPRTLELCQRSQADEVWLLTPTQSRKTPEVDRVFQRVPIFETPRIYRSCDVVVKLSYVEGMFGPPLEMFHCGGTAITYDVTGHDEYIRHGENALVARRDDENQVVRYINQLRSDREFLNRLNAGARATAAAWNDWDESSRKFQTAVEQIVAYGTLDQKTLEKRTLAFMEFYALVERTAAERASIFGKAELKLRQGIKGILGERLSYDIARLENFVRRR